MTAVKIDSNVTGLRLAEEESLRVLPTTPDWIPQEPNSYGDFGGSIVTIARNPINEGRKRKKGVTTDLSGAGGFVSDVTQKNIQDPMQGFLLADLRRKAEFGVTSGNFTSVATTDDSYNAASGLDVFRAGDLIFAAGFSLQANNGLKVVDAVASGKVEVAENLADETPGAGVGSLVQVGFQFGSGEVEIVADPGEFPVLTRASGTKDFTEFGLIPGETIFVGGDGAAEQFANEENNGWCRVRAVTATTIQFDKTQFPMVDDDGASKTIRIFFGRVLRDETGTDIVRRTYQLERTLGVPDPEGAPSEVQAEYLIGCTGSRATFTMGTADKFVVNLEFVPIDVETRLGSEGLKTGNRPALEEADAFNTSSDVVHVKMALVEAGNACPDSLFTYVEDLEFFVDNSVTPEKAIGTLGAIDVTVGTFLVGGSCNAYFTSVLGQRAVRDNLDVTFECHLSKANAGISFDMPLVSLADARPNVEQDRAIRVPLEIEAATGAKIASTLNHTIMIVWYDYLPTLAA